MTIKKYLGKTREEALEAARQELGPDMVVMNVKEIRNAGLGGMFRRPSYEVTAAVEDDSPTPSYMEVVASAQQHTQAEGMRRFDAVADDEVTLPTQQPQQTPPPRPPRVQPSVQERREQAENVARPVSSQEEEDLRSAFREVGEVMQQASALGRLPRSAASTYDKNATIIKYNDPAASVEYTRSKDTTRVRREEPLAFEEDILEEKESGTVRPVQHAEAPNAIIKAVYNMLLDHEVDERYINQVMGDLDIDAMGDMSVEAALGLVYQKLVLKFGRPKTIELTENRPKVVFFVGPTGVGKTTTIAKLASQFRINEKKKVALFTADTYRIAALDQLAEYGNLMQIDVVVLFEADDINEKIEEKYKKYDLILVDTTGFSHHDEEQRESIANLLHSLSDRYDRQIYLVLSATTKYRDLKQIVDAYHEFTDFDLIFTKLDETEVHGNILNTSLYADAPLSYVTTGQNVPSDIEIIDAQKMVRGLLGGS